MLPGPPMHYLPYPTLHVPLLATGKPLSRGYPTLPLLYLHPTTMMEAAHVVPVVSTLFVALVPILVDLASALPLH